ncbi:Trypanosome variant surface glycoprotein (A-type)/Trypanosome variant surface glycoprotein C-terminal domain containing protein, putative [Trypanosoma equiperdum]|uniref:Trypanosome variant surface glycoprotein (A-type)/Trypanosome variant surface glycoprotein C-terminal domain containing protein, putative n=1 Tax=Trypanosoma equiperdum TaxID=5694 RepID=A0A1G4I1J6_TRYEQ|nr:Trypanosome variant surface glycoprotein (A-type)/Trypanosome variant surface glycoprotein C-terminal domain containing protein, putative [Trypanosoma equiperdum]
MRKNSKLLLSLAVTALTQTNNCKAVNQKPLVKATWSAICDTYAALRHKANSIKGIPRASAVTAAELANLALKAEIKLQQPASNAEQKRIDIMAAYVRLESEAAAAALRHDTQTQLTNDLFSIGLALGRLKEFMTLASGPIETNTKGCITTSKLAAGLISGITALTSAYDSCKALEDKDPTNLNSADIITENGFANITQQTNVNNAAAETGCKLTTLTNNEGYVSGTLTTNTLNVAAGLIHITKGNHGTNGMNNFKTSPGTGDSEDMYKAWQAAVKPTPISHSFKKKKLPDLKKDGTFIMAAKLVLNITNEDGTNLGTKLNEIFGAEDDDELSGSWKPIESFGLNTNVAGQKAGTALSAIKDPTVLTKILVHYRNVATAETEKRIAKLQTTAKLGQKAKAIAIECGTISKAEECNNADQCCFDDSKETGKKCKFNETKATANGVPVPESGEDKKLTKCTDVKTEEECKNVACKIPEGKKAVCGWIENTCKDSSILVNKKLAL